jgi:protocatechuate 3,4-dioxygenase beta subunit
MLQLTGDHAGRICLGTELHLQSSDTLKSLTGGNTIMPRRVDVVEDRRVFIKSVCVFAVCCAAAPVSWACSGHQAETQSPHPSAIEIATAQEPGTPIQISGTIFDLNGRPVPGVKMFLYHTDNTGYYSRPVNNPRQARLNGTLWTNSLGQYSFNTIKPAHYGDVSSPPAIHIHVHLQPPGGPDHWVESFYFEGDPHLRIEEPTRHRELGRFSNIISLASSSNVLKGIRDFRIDPVVAERNKV